MKRLLNGGMLRSSFSFVNERYCNAKRNGRLCVIGHTNDFWSTSFHSRDISADNFFTMRRI